MKLEARIFGGVCAFAWLVAIIYGIGTWYGSVDHHIEVTGFIGLIMTGALAFIVATYFQFVSRRLRPRPEDNEQADVSDGSGEMGFFPPGSYWPFGMGIAAGVGGLALAFWQIWLIIIGALVMGATIAGLVFEFHVGPNKD
jgi:hypothetical protein